MNKMFFDLAIALNECSTLALAAAKNVNYMQQIISNDITSEDYISKVARMERELEPMYKRVADLKKLLREYNQIAMQ